jgi:hypothetical protein
MCSRSGVEALKRGRPWLDASWLNRVAVVTLRIESEFGAAAFGVVLGLATALLIWSLECA